MNTHNHHQAQTKASQAGETRLSDTALLLLGQAGTRPDGMVLPPPASLRARGSALGKVLMAMLKAELISEVPVETDTQRWRTDDANQRVGLKITAAGLRAIGMEGTSPPQNTEAPVDAGPVTPERPDEAPQTPARSSKGSGLELDPAPEVRRITKQSRLVTLLSGDHGQSVAVLAETLSWLPHTVRAALTGLRQKGHVLVKTKDAAGTTVYRIAAPDTAALNSAPRAA